MGGGGDDPEISFGRGGQVPASAQVVNLSEPECWAMLRKHNLGRLAILIEGKPAIFPVNYAAGEGAVVFRTQPGAKLTHGPGSDAAFEIDGYDHGSGLGWSVVAVGPLNDITEATDEKSLAMRRLPVETTAPGARVHWLAIEPARVTGRSFRGGWMVPGGYLG
jgi:uncharacterized protein